MWFLCHWFGGASEKRRARLDCGDRLAPFSRRWSNSHHGPKRQICVRPSESGQTTFTDWCDPGGGPDRSWTKSLDLGPAGNGWSRCQVESGTSGAGTLDARMRAREATVCLRLVMKETKCNRNEAVGKVERSIAAISFFSIPELLSVPAQLPHSDKVSAEVSNPPRAVSSL